MMRILLLSVLAAAVAARAEVRVFVQEINGLAWVNHECTAGEVVRAFALADLALTPVFAGAIVDPAMLIRDITLRREVLTIDFQGGELEFAASIDGPWVGTGNRTGRFMEPGGTSPTRFYRVSRP